MPLSDNIASRQASLVEQCRKGDRQALAELYSQHHDQLLKMAMQIVPDKQAAQDVEHDAWVMILSSLNALSEPNRISAWMRAIVKNTALNYLKYNKTHSTESLNFAPEPEELEETCQEISFEQISVLVAQLPDGYKQVFRLKMFEGLSHRQIADRLGISENTSRSQLHRAKAIMRNLIQQYWMLPVVAAIISVTVLLTTKNTSDTQPGKPIPEPTTAKTTPSLTVPRESDTSQYGTSQPPIARHFGKSDVVTPEIGITDTSTATISNRGFVPCVPTLNLPLLPHITGTPTLPPQISTATRTLFRPKWNIQYGGVPGSGTTVIDNFLTVINFAAPGQTQSAQLFTWKDYANYIKANEAHIDTATLKIMRSRLEQHTDTIDKSDSCQPDSISYDATPLSETKRHERPRTYMLSMAFPLSKRWSITSGIGVKTMKSTFESEDNGNYIEQRTQKLYYLSVPLGATYNIWQHRRLSVYATASVQLDIPLKGKSTTRYLYTGPFEPAQPDSLVFPTVRNRIHPPLQWSVGAGVGAQFKLLPHMNLYIEPSLRYYFPTHNGIENYHTTHPFDFTLPIGLRIVP